MDLPLLVQSIVSRLEDSVSFSLKQMGRHSKVGIALHAKLKSFGKTSKASMPDIQILASLFVILLKGDFFTRHAVAAHETHLLVEPGRLHPDHPAIVRRQLLRLVTLSLVRVLPKLTTYNKRHTFFRAHESVKDICRAADAKSGLAASAPYSLRVPSHLRCIFIDLDAAVFDSDLALPFLQLADQVEGVLTDHVIVDLLLLMVPHRPHIHALGTSAVHTGRELFVFSRQSRIWTAKISSALFGVELPLTNILTCSTKFSEKTEPSLKIGLLGHIMQRAGVKASDVLLIDAGRGTALMAAGRGHSTLEVVLGRGLHMKQWKARMTSVVIAADCDPLFSTQHSDSCCSTDTCSLGRCSVGSFWSVRSLWSRSSGGHSRTSSLSSTPSCTPRSGFHCSDWLATPVTGLAINKSKGQAGAERLSNSKVAGVVDGAGAHVAVGAYVDVAVVGKEDGASKTTLPTMVGGSGKALAATEADRGLGVANAMRKVKKWMHGGKNMSGA